MFCRLIIAFVASVSTVVAMDEIKPIVKDDTKPLQSIS